MTMPDLPLPTKRWVAIGSIAVAVVTVGGFVATPLARAWAFGGELGKVPATNALVARHETRLTTVEARVQDCEHQRRLDADERRKVLTLQREILARLRK